MTDELQESPHTQPIDKVARKSRNTLVIMQVVMACLMGGMIFSLVLGGLIVYSNKSKLQQQVTINTEQRIRIQAAVSAEIEEQHRVNSALCDNQFTIATAPVPADGSKILVQFVESSRKAFVLLGCRGRLPTPTVGLVKAAKTQGVPIRY